jgi:hypothetical protein
VPSARRTGIRAAALSASAFGAVGLAGCHTTTQETSARLAVKSERVLARAKPVELGKPSRDLKVLGSSIVGSGKDRAIVATLRNTSSHPVNDVPIGVGVRSASGTPDLLNLGRGTPYFQSHLSAIAPGATSVFVFRTRKSLPPGSPVVVPGTPSDPPTVAKSLPQLEVTSKLDPGGTATVQLENPTSIPQYDIEVYAAASRDGRVVAAGAAPLDFLNSGGSASVRVPMAGNAKNARVQVFVPPTIFS